MDNFDEYSGCAVKYECGGGCRAFAYALYGRLDGPPDPVTCVWKKGLAEFSKLSEQDQDPWNRRLGYVVRQIQGGTCEKGAVFQAGGIPYRQFPVQSCFFHWHGLSLLFTGLFLLAMLLLLPAAALRLPVALANTGWVAVDLIFITLGVGLQE